MNENKTKNEFKIKINDKNWKKPPQDPNNYVHSHMETGDVWISISYTHTN